jgi:hypothetical protein
MTMILHCGGRLAHFEEVAAVELPDHCRTRPRRTGLFRTVIWCAWSRRR